MNARSVFSWAAVFVFATGVFGLYSVPVVAAVCGWFRWQGAPVRTAGVAAAVSWLLLLLVAGLRGPVIELATTLGGVMGVPGPAIFGVALIFPAVLGGAAAGLAGAVRTGLDAQRRATSPTAQAVAGGPSPQRPE